MAGVGKNTAKRDSRDSWCAMPHNGLYAGLSFFSSGRLARVTAVEPVPGTDSDFIGLVVADADAGGCAKERTGAAEMDGQSVVECAGDGMDREIPGWPGVLVGNRCRLGGMWWGWGESNSRPAV